MIPLKRIVPLYIAVVVIFIESLYALPFQEQYVLSEKAPQAFPMVENGKAAPLYISDGEYSGILRVAKHFQNDIRLVTNVQPEVFVGNKPAGKEIVIIGTIEKSKYIQQLVKERKLDVTNLRGKWETFQIQIIENPLKGVERALVIVGSDKRGAMYGMFDISEQMGVSPWYWWADVPPKKKANVYVKNGMFTCGTPKVKYRGIFINDEAPALTDWVYEKFGGFNHNFYEHVFELIIRLKGNFLWPAMWGKAFYDDDSLNAPLADEYGVVISTSHHEPMMRAQDEWRRYGSGPWNYEKNEDKLREFWRKGIERMNHYESIVTVGMRGDGDEPMSDETNIALLERIVQDQRQILSEVTGKEASEIPQVWALYKEVQDYYDKGMRVPDDVTLLLCDDNWGNIRKLPDPNEKPRKGGYGIYYHYDYVGGPRNYKWLNTNQIERVWEQMHLAYEFGARQIWIVNVGDIKPMEFPISFFLDYAWDPEKISHNQLQTYTKDWSSKQFGEIFTNEIAECLELYTKYNSRRKPEMLFCDTYSLVNYREFELVVADYKRLENRVRVIGNSLPSEYQDAFYQLVLHPIEACANLNELYYSVGKNHLYFQQGRVLTNFYAQKARELFERDAEITRRYHSLGNGRWNHMMSQTHIGYTYWQQPDSNSMPAVYEYTVPEATSFGVAVEGSEHWLPHDSFDAVLPMMDRFNQQARYIEIFNRGSKPIEYSVIVKEPWIQVSSNSGVVKTEERLWVTVQWDKAPVGEYRVPIVIVGPNKTKLEVYALIHNPSLPEANTFEGFIESDGYVSIEAEHTSRKLNSQIAEWIVIPNLGRTLSAVTLTPVTIPTQKPDSSCARLDYDVFFYSSGNVDVDVYLSPTLNYTHRDGLRYAISFDDENPQIVNIHALDTIPDWKYPQHWNKIVSENINILTTSHTINSPGKHTLKIWGMDAGVVVQKIVMKTGTVKPSYLGPPESYQLKKTTMKDKKL